MAEIRYRMTYNPEVCIYFDAKGNLMAHEIDLPGSRLTQMYDHKTGQTFDSADAASEHMGKIIYGSIVERLGSLALTQFFYDPNDEPF
jgi:hypothetical protein